jgi:hypothetical protein
VLLPIGVRRQAEQNARDERRSLSNYLATLVEGCVGERDVPGFLKRKPAPARQENSP